jgi:MarR family transcriptional regulator for hemolysin
VERATFRAQFLLPNPRCCLRFNAALKYELLCVALSGVRAVRFDPAGRQLGIHAPGEIDASPAIARFCRHLVTAAAYSFDSITLDIVTLVIIYSATFHQSPAMEQLRNFGYLLKDLGRLYTRRFEERAGALHLTLPHCKTLGYLARNEGVSQVRLGELTEMDPMSMVRILDYMEAEGWVERRPDPNDRRARCLFIKDKARAILDEMLKLADETRTEFLGALSPDESLRLVDMLERIHASARALGTLSATSDVAPATKTVKRISPADDNRPASTS